MLDVCSRPGLLNSSAVYRSTASLRVLLAACGLEGRVPCNCAHPTTAAVPDIYFLSPPAVCGPSLSPSRFNWSAVLVLPIAFVFVSYLQHQKDLSDKALALGVVQDPKVGVVACTAVVALPLWYQVFRLLPLVFFFLRLRKEQQHSVRYRSCTKRLFCCTAV